MNNTSITTTTTTAAQSAECGGVDGIGVKQSLKAIGDMPWFIRSQWGEPGRLGNDKFFGPEGLNAMAKSLGLKEMQECIEIVGDMDPKSRSIRCLKGVIKKRAAERAQAAAQAISAQPKPAASTSGFVLFRCTECPEEAQIPVARLLPGRGQTFQCTVCGANHKVNDFLPKEYW